MNNYVVNGIETEILLFQSEQRRAMLLKSREKRQQPNKRRNKKYKNKTHEII